MNKLITDYSKLNPQDLRNEIRQGKFPFSSTSGAAQGFQQANLLIIPEKCASDFERFCALNPQPCPLLCPPLKPGEREAKELAPGSDITVDLTGYRVYKRHSESPEQRVDTCDFVRRENICQEFQNDSVTFLMGCSFGFEKDLMDNGIPVRNIEEGKNVSMYITNQRCKSVGPFESPLVVSMRPIRHDLVKQAIEIAGKHVKAHGAPVHVGNPEGLGIKNLSQVDFGEALTIRDGEVPVFWACGVTSLVAALHALNTGDCEYAITHEPGCMFITSTLL